MYRSSVGLLVVGFVALVYGWVRQSNPATYLAMVLVALAAIFLVASIAAERRRRRGGLGGAEPTLGSAAWIPPPDRSADAPSTTRGRRDPVGPSLPQYEPAPSWKAPAAAGPSPSRSSSFTLDAARSAAAESAPAPPPSPGMWPDEADGHDDATLSFPTPLPADDAPGAVGGRDDGGPRKRFGRRPKATDPDRAARPWDDAADRPTLTRGSPAAAYPLLDPEDPDSPERRLSRATREAEALLSLPDDAYDVAEPAPAAGSREPSTPARAPASYRPASEAPAQYRPASEAPAQYRPASEAPARSRQEQDQFLEAAMRRRQAREAPQAPSPEQPGAGSTEVLPWSARRRRARGLAPDPAGGATPGGPAGVRSEPPVPAEPEPAPRMRARPVRPPLPDLEPDPEPAIAPWRQHQPQAPVGDVSVVPMSDSPATTRIPRTPRRTGGSFGPGSGASGRAAGRPAPAPKAAPKAVPKPDPNVVEITEETPSHKPAVRARPAVRASAAPRPQPQPEATAPAPDEAPPPTTTTTGRPRRPASSF